MKIINCLFYGILTVLFISCTQTDDQKYAHLRSKVLEHYSNDSNPLKEKAARFLLDNLKDLYAIDGERTQLYAAAVKEYYQNPDTLHKNLLTIRDIKAPEEIVKDISTLTPKSLIDNIDRAFETWENSSWKKEITFN